MRKTIRNVKVIRNIIVILLIIAAILISLGLVVVLHKEEVYGIPCGIYCPIDENGNVLDTVLEYKWQIGKKYVEFQYAQGKIEEDNGKLYWIFDTEFESSKLTFEIKYDTVTRVLTVCMPEKYPTIPPDNLGGKMEGDIKPFYYKIK